MRRALEGMWERRLERGTPAPGLRHSRRKRADGCIRAEISTISRRALSCPIFVREVHHDGRRRAAHHDPAKWARRGRVDLHVWQEGRDMDEVAGVGGGGEL